jgi:hypothetical protein
MSKPKKIQPKIFWVGRQNSRSSLLARDILRNIIANKERKQRRN